MVFDSQPQRQYTFCTITQFSSGISVAVLDRFGIECIKTLFFVDSLTCFLNEEMSNILSNRLEGRGWNFIGNPIRSVRGTLETMYFDSKFLKWVNSALCLDLIAFRLKKNWEWTDKGAQITFMIIPTLSWISSIFEYLGMKSFHQNKRLNAKNNESFEIPSNLIRSSAF